MASTPLPGTDSRILRCVSPVDGSVYAQRPLNDVADISHALDSAKKAQGEWARTPLERRQRILLRALDHLLKHAEDIGEEITWQMGRPVSQAKNEITGGVNERWRYLVSLAPAALADIAPEEKEGFRRYVAREPLGTVVVIAPWNYPYLTAMNGIVPALLSGNAVILRHSHQTPLAADRFAAAFRAAELPQGVFQVLHLSHHDAEQMIADPRVDHVNFTGSVRGGRAVQAALSRRFIGAGLELGGNDPAYVRPDADMERAVEGLVDGAFFNSGQCCCGIERIYVHAGVYDTFLEGFVARTKQYRLGNPLEEATNLGPLAKTGAADGLRARVRKAMRQGAAALVDEKDFDMSREGTPYFAPHVLVNVTHDMEIMQEELFGPVVGIMKVSSDEEAVRLMNDSRYGLTASLWTRDADAAARLGREIETGTVFMNRCDYVDPGLCWTGVKDSGRGGALGRIGFEQMTRPKSYHLRF